MLIVVITILAIFYVASILYQFKGLQKRINKFDKLHLLPNYSFFAPNPLVNDFRLVYKINEENLGNSSWEELNMYKKFSFKRIFWNPFKYYNKGMIDICQYLTREFHAVKDKDKMKLSLNHINIVLTIFRYLQKKGKKISGLKFAIVSSEGCEDLKIKKVIYDSNYQII